MTALSGAEYTPAIAHLYVAVDRAISHVRIYYSDITTREVGWY